MKHVMIMYACQNSSFYWFVNVCNMFNHLDKTENLSFIPKAQDKVPGPPTDGRDHPSHARENVQSAGVAPQRVSPSSKNVAKSFACEVPESFGGIRDMEHILASCKLMEF